MERIALERQALLSALKDPVIKAVADAAAREEFGVDERGQWVYPTLNALIAGQDARSVRDGNQAGWRYVREAKRFIAMYAACYRAGDP